MKTIFLALVAILMITSISEVDPLTGMESGKRTFYPLRLECPPHPALTRNLKQTAGNDNSSDAYDKGWYQQAIELIRKEEYNISYSEELNAFQSLNKANNLSFTYHNDGFTAKPQAEAEPLCDIDDKLVLEKDRKHETSEDWSIRFKVICSDLTEGTGELRASGNKAHIEYDKMRIDYTNNENGMRQDFIIKQKPAGEGKLRLHLKAETQLKMIAGADALMFKNERGEEKMKYSALKVWDANGRELRAYFEKNNYELGIENYELRTRSEIKTIPNSKFVIPNSFSIVVNDEDAVYPVTIDPLSSTPDWTMLSDQADTEFGYSVSTAGDVNGDGYSDVIVSARSYSNGQTNEGRVFVYHGSSTGLSATANWTAESDVAVSYFGDCVSTAGDVNGDGYSDVIVGAQLLTNGQTREGKVFVWLGSSTGLGPNGTPSNADWSAESNQTEARFGTSVSTAGDVNGDGYSDVIIGSPYYNNGEYREGRVFVYHGSSTGLSASANWTAESNQISALMGHSVCTAGDVNGDGFSDVVVGAPEYDNGQTDEGRAFVFIGSSAGLSASASWTAESNQAGAVFGNSVSTAGDINGDGYSDVIVGATGFDIGSSFTAGKTFLYNGSSSGLSPTENWTADYILQPNVQFGWRVSTAGDVNGDGYSDVIIGAILFTGFEVSEGATFVYYGSSSGLSSSANWTAEGNQPYMYLGYSVSTAGDVNGDGYSDVIIGASNLVGTSNDGKAFVYYGAPSGPSASANRTYESNLAFANYGWSVSTAGDVNGDGYADVIIGAFQYANGQANEGRAYVYHGSANGLPASANWTAESNQVSANFGYSVSTAGDVNGDGYSDIIIGAYLYDNGENDEGQVFVWYGSSSGLGANGTPGNADWTAQGNQATAEFGSSVATAGDVNGDGYSDVIVGAQSFSNGNNNEGMAFVYYGSAAGLSSVAYWNGESNQGGALFGSSVSGAGDVNGDGYSDVIVGAIRLDNGQTDEGKSFVYHGSASGLSTAADWTFESNQAGAYLGNVSGSGDVNGDGYSDVIVGARFYTNGETGEGRAFVFHGSASGLSASANWTAESDQSSGIIGAQFGLSVCTAGDVNGDGYSDVIVGAPAYDNGESDEGRAFVFYGSASGLSADADWTAESNQMNATFGMCVSTAGDVNGDGYSDVIVGANLFDNGQEDEGRALAYYGNEVNGMSSSVAQYKPGSSNIVYSGGLTGTNGQARINIFGKSPFGRADGKFVYEYKANGVAFSGPVLTNSVSSTGSGSITDLGVPGIQFNRDLSGLLTNREYKWRARVQYSLVNNPYQKFGPWKYYVNYVPVPSGSIKARTVPPSVFSYTFKGLIQGFYNSADNKMKKDTVQITLRSTVSPYQIAGTSKAYLDSLGNGTFSFTGLVNNAQYYVQVNHRNSVETWSKTGQVFTASSMTYNFTTADTKAYGDNMIQVDASPVRYAFYSGDVNQDGTVDATDVSAIDNDASNFASGYVVTDLTGDDFVDGTDFALADNNAANFVSAITP